MTVRSLLLCAFDMAGFIALNLIMALLVQYRVEQIGWLSDASVQLAIAALGLAFLLGGWRFRLRTQHWHDGFAGAVVLLWYGQWLPLFDDDAPMFFYYPVYFALLTAILNLSLIQKAADFDVESVLHLRYLESMTRFSMRFVIGLVLASLAVPQHYTLFPVMMTFFIVRHTMLVCLEMVDRPNEN
jgi:hypothetical protein